MVSASPELAYRLVSLFFFDRELFADNENRPLMTYLPPLRSEVKSQKDTWDDDMWVFLFIAYEVWPWWHWQRVCFNTKFKLRITGFLFINMVYMRLTLWLCDWLCQGEILNSALCWVKENNSKSVKMKVRGQLLMIHNQFWYCIWE